MRRTALALVSLSVFSLGLVARPARAQDSDTARDAEERTQENFDGIPEGESGGESGDAVEDTVDERPARAVEASDLEVEGGNPSREETQVTAPESYTVQPGDTLWNLSQRYLNNPWYWPKVWSYNPQLDNPNWIYPGSVVRFYPGQPDEPQDDLGDDEGDFDDVPRFETGAGLADRLRDLAGAGGGGRRREFFVPSDRLEEAGRILNSPEEKQLLSIYDGAYIKLKKGNAGETLQIYREERELRHPATGSNLGKIVTLVGEVRIDQLSKEQSRGVITASWDPIERGYYVGELPTRTENVRKKPNTKKVKGYIVDAAPYRLSLLGETYVVVVDKGQSDGVEVGNSFTVVRGLDPYTQETAGLIDEDVGEIMIIEVFKNVSTGVLVQSTRDLAPGDRIEMRVQ